MPRPARLVAIARRDLKMELKGRRGLGLPLVMAGLLLPISGAPPIGLPQPSAAPAIAVSGDVPESVLALESVQVGDPGALRFERTPERIEVAGDALTPEIRATLDADDPAPVAVSWTRRPIPLPNRSLLFALISASTLTGAVSASVGGERSAGTLVALLAAAVTRAEVVLGKWLGWGGLGAFTACGAALVAVLLGRLDAGWWMLPMVTVPLCAVALSLWLVRRASDVIGGTTVTLRVVPALVGTSGLLSWFVGLDQPLLGAAIPMGGALVAAGSTWGTGPLPALVAAGSTLAATGLMLAATWRDLEETIGPPAPPSPRGLALRTSVLAGLIWWPPLLGPLLWASAGNAELTATLPRGPGVLAAALGLLLLTWVHGLRSTLPGEQAWAERGDPRWWAAGIATGALLGLVFTHPLTPLPERFAEIQLRLWDGLWPGQMGLLAVVSSALATETLFRGWLPARSGWGWATFAWIAVCAPFDPVGGLVTGLAFAALARRGGVWAAVSAHLALGAVTLL